MKILVLNCGSSSAKYMVYDWDAKDIMCKGIVERVTIGGSFCEHEATGRDKVKIERECPTHKEAVELIMELLVSPEYGVLNDVKEIDAVGHRVVHGGERFAKSVVIDDEVIKAFKELEDLAPLHNPANVLGIEAALRGSLSTKKASPAPLLNASIPILPLPANRSRNKLPGTRGVIILNNASFTKSVAGRRCFTFLVFRRLPLAIPPITRSDIFSPINMTLNKIIPFPSSFYN
jgi:hypothetical protein